MHWLRWRKAEELQPRAPAPRGGAPSQASLRHLVTHGRPGQNYASTSHSRLIRTCKRCQLTSFPSVWELTPTLRLRWHPWPAASQNAKIARRESSTGLGENRALSRQPTPPTNTSNRTTEPELESREGEEWWLCTRCSGGEVTRANPSGLRRGDTGRLEVARPHAHS
jgi:hypothetical protein